MLITRKNTMKDFRIRLETQREHNNYIIEIVCNTILELIELEKEIETILNFEDIFIEVLYKKIDKLEISYKEYKIASVEIIKKLKV
jgi:hypothetical protein